MLAVAGRFAAEPESQLEVKNTDLWDADICLFVCPSPSARCFVMVYLSLVALEIQITSTGSRSQPQTGQTGSFDQYQNSQSVWELDSVGLANTVITL